MDRRDLEAFVFATIYEYLPDNSKRVTNFDSDLSGRNEFSVYERSTLGSGRVMFLRGFASPEWLNLVGSLYRVDPEFFRRHLDFLQPQKHHEIPTRFALPQQAGLKQQLSLLHQIPTQFDLPSLPSTSENIVRLQIVSIVSRSDGHRTSARSSLSDLRSQASEDVRLYLRQALRDGQIGRSIVRRYLMHDEKYSTIEQEISLCVEQQNRGWTGKHAPCCIYNKTIDSMYLPIAIVWSDCGRNLMEVPGFSWCSKTASSARGHECLPTYQHKAKMALKTSNIDSDPNPKKRDTLFSDSFQSAAAYPRFFGGDVDPHVAHHDAFYTLIDIFRFSAFSENQCLNIMEYIIQKETNPPMDLMQESLANLQHAKSMLQAHLQRLESTTLFIERRGCTKWPKASQQEHIEIVDATARDLLNDFKHLIARAKLLSNRCTDETNLVMNRAMLEEAQRAISQGAVVARLTLLAFLFIPLSFTTSFFGMNLEELVGSSNSTLGLWTWFAVSVPLFLLSLLLLYWNVIQRAVHRRLSR